MTNPFVAKLNSAKISLKIQQAELKMLVCKVQAFDYLKQLDFTSRAIEFDLATNSFDDSTLERYQKQMNEEEQAGFLPIVKNLVELSNKITKLTQKLRNNE